MQLLVYTYLDAEIGHFLRANPREIVLRTFLMNVQLACVAAQTLPDNAQQHGVASVAVCGLRISAQETHWNGCLDMLTLSMINWCPRVYDAVWYGC